MPPRDLSFAVTVYITREDGVDAGVMRLDLAVPSSITLGRQQGCDVVLESEQVSRVHARLLFSRESFVVEDASSNGTLLLGDGSILHRAHRELPYGDAIRMGPFVLRAEEPLPVGSDRPRQGPLQSSLQASLNESMAASLSVSGGRRTTALPPAVTPRRAKVSSAPVAISEAKAAGADDVALRRSIHAELLKNLDLAKVDPSKEDPSLRPRVLTALKRIFRDRDHELPSHIDRDAFIGELLEEAIGLGPLEPLLADPTVTEIMVVDPVTIYVERRGRLEKTSTRFTDNERVRAIIERIVTPLGRRIDESQPLVDARLKNGSRVNAIIRPLALRGTCITIRKFPDKRLTVKDLLSLKSTTPRIARFLERCVAAKKNVLISGGTGSGKTTLLNILSSAIPADERIVTIEDAAELQLHQPHVVPLETKPANMEGKGAFTIRELVKNALRMRPDRIVVGECRGGEALDMLQAMNTGHDGSLTTIHANSPLEALARLETLVLMAGLDLPSRAIREQIGRSIHVIVQISRMGDGSRKLTDVTEVIGLDREGRFETRTLFEFEREGVDRDGTVIGEHHATGYLPSFVDEFIVRGLVAEGEPCI